MNLKRYQVYLNPYSVSVLDGFKKTSNMSRSKLIREAIDRVAEQFVAIFAWEKKTQKTKYFDKLCGFIDLKTKKKTHFAENVDEIYLTD